MRCLAEQMQEHAGRHWRVGPLLGSESKTGQTREGPFRLPTPRMMRMWLVRSVLQSSEEVQQAISDAVGFAGQWDQTPAQERASMLEHAADLFQENMPEFLVLCAGEAGRTVNDGISEVREAVDFLRYYAAQARERFAEPLIMPGPTGERNEVSLHGRGVFTCISPWNFPWRFSQARSAQRWPRATLFWQNPPTPHPLLLFVP